MLHRNLLLPLRLNLSWMDKDQQDGKQALDIVDSDSDQEESEPYAGPMTRSRTKQQNLQLAIANALLEKYLEC